MIVLQLGTFIFQSHNLFDDNWATEISLFSHSLTSYLSPNSLSASKQTNQQTCKTKTSHLS